MSGYFFMYFLIGFMIAVGMRTYDIRQNPYDNGIGFYVAVALGWGLVFAVPLVYLPIACFGYAIKGVSGFIARIYEEYG